MRIKILVILSLVLVLAEFDAVLPAYAVPGDCISGPCIGLNTDPLTGEIVGRGTSISPGSAASRAAISKKPNKKSPVKKSPTKKRKVPAPVANPICTIEQLATFTCVKSAAQAVPTRPVMKATPAKPTVITTDEVRRSLPRANPGFQPLRGAVVNVPVIFWSGVTTPVRFSMSVLGHQVQVEMAARFQWSWGDGTSSATTLVGAPFPSRDLTHTYSRSGDFPVSVITTWSGSANLGSVLVQIVGSPIETIDEITVRVGQAPTLLTTVE